MAGLYPHKRTGGWRVTVMVRGVRRDLYLAKGVTARDAKLFAEKAGKLERARNMATQVDPAVAEWVDALAPQLRVKLAKAGLIDKPLEQAEGAAVRLGRFVDQWIAGRQGLKPNTLRNLRQSRGYLVGHFGENCLLAGITPGHADEYREALVGKGLSPATVAREVKRARQVIKAAMRKGVVAANAFADVKGGKQENASRFHFVSLSDYQAVLDACPDLEWRCLLALGRIGGLRVPSEVTGLRWSDIDWEHNWFTVHSPKLEAHPDKATRRVPLFPGLRDVLDEAWVSAPDRAEFVLPTIRDPRKNLRTRFERIIKRAGLSPWPRLFQNLRASRATELVSAGAENQPSMGA